MDLYQHVSLETTGGYMLDTTLPQQGAESID